MDQRNANSIQRPLRFKPAFTNVVVKKKIVKKKMPQVASRTRVVVRPPVVKNRPVVVHERKVAPRIVPKKISPATTAALHAAMSRMFPNNYPCPVPTNPDVTVPLAPICNRQRFSVTTLANGSGSYEMVVVLCNQPACFINYALAYTAGSPTATGCLNSNCNAGVLTNYSNIMLVSGEIILRALAASSSIQGQWVVANVPYVATVNTLNFATLATYSSAKVGEFTDAMPSVRGIWLPLDESDTALQPVGTSPAAGSGTTVICVQTASAALFQAEVIANFTGFLSSVGSAFIPATSALVDDGAYARAMDSLTKMINTNSDLISNPAVADKQHAGLLRRAAEYIAGTAVDASALVQTVANVVSVGSNLVTGASSLFGMPLFETLLRISRGVLDEMKRNPCALDALPPEYVRQLRLLLSWEIVLTRNSPYALPTCEIKHALPQRDATSMAAENKTVTRRFAELVGAYSAQTGIACPVSKIPVSDHAVIVTAIGEDGPADPAFLAKMRKALAVYPNAPG